MPVHEGLTTLLARIGLALGVGSFVCLETAGPAEGFPALLARVRVFPAVCSFVCLEGVGRTEGLAALLTLIDSAVGLFMDSKVAEAFEGFTALLTSMRLFARVGPFMDLK